MIVAVLINAVIVMAAFVLVEYAASRDFWGH